MDFADDIALLESTMSQAQAQLNMNRTATAAKELGLIISVPKTEYMTANCHPQPPLQVYGEAIKHVTDFKYLGSQMDHPLQVTVKDARHWHGVLSGN